MNASHNAPLMDEAYSLLETRTMKETANVFAGEVNRAVEMLRRNKIDIHDPSLRRLRLVGSVIKQLDPRELGRTDRRLRAKILWVLRRLRR